MSQITNKAWWTAAGIRALKTIAQTAVASIGTAAAVEQVDWRLVISASVVSGLLSILTSLGGLPEVKFDPEAQEGEYQDEANLADATEDDDTDSAE